MYSREDFDVVIGMEFHLQVNSQTKLFSRAHMGYGDEPNTHVSVVDNGMPGALPCVNKYCVEAGIKTALALNMHVNHTFSFDRKHYSYPDLPLKYQITQFFQPIAQDGYLKVNDRKIRFNRMALEADAGKNIHLGDSTYVDLNRCGSPLMEIVTEPDMRSEEEAVDLFNQIRSIAKYIGTSDADMEKGQLRADVNVSINLKGAKEYGTRVEIKNINSMNFAQQALRYEIDRHIKTINAGEQLVMETRTFDPSTKTTISMRKKEVDADYRYMPDPDLVPIHLEQNTIDQIRQTLPELPHQKIARWCEECGLTTYEAAILAEDPETASYFDETSKCCLDAGLKAKDLKQVAVWMLGDFAAAVNKDLISYHASQITPNHLSELIVAIVKEVISGKQAKDVFKEMYETGKSAEKIIKEKNIMQITDPKQLSELARQVISNNSKQVEQYKGGNENLFGFFVGQAMKLSQGKANPELINKIIKEELNKLG